MIRKDVRGEMDEDVDEIEPQGESVMKNDEE